MKAIELLNEHRNELSEDAIAVLERADNYSLSVALVDDTPEEFNERIACDPKYYDDLLGIKDETSINADDAAIIMEWIESEGVLGYDDGAFIMDEEEFEDSFRHNNEGDLSKEDYARQICKDSLMKAGIPEEMAELGVDYYNEKSTEKFSAWLKGTMHFERKEKKMAERMQFMAGEGRYFDGGVNYIMGNGYYAEISVPDGASEDFGYITMKEALIKKYPETADFAWWYDRQEDMLAEDARANAEVYVDDK